MTKEQMIEELMKDAYASSEANARIEAKLSRKPKNVIAFYFNTQYLKGVKKKFVIDNIIRIG